MLKKLLKYDFDALKTPLFIILIVSWCVATICGFCWNGFFGLMESYSGIVTGGEDTFPTDWLLASILLYVISLVFLVLVCSSGAVALVFIWLRYYRHLYSDQGLLTFMLPVKRRTLINEKILFGLICYVILELMITAEVITISYFGFFGHERALLVLDGIFQTVFTSADFSCVVLGLKWAYLFVISACYSVIVPYACITIGSIIAKRHKILVSVGLYLGISTIIGSIVGGVAVYTGIKTSYYWVEEIEDEAVFQSIRSVFNTSFYIVSVFYIVLIITAFYLIHYLNKKKLNLAG